MYEYIITKRVSFDAAHFLPDYNGKCKNMHGHTWYIEVGVKGNELKNGMLFDFKDLKNILKDICERFDHKVLNETESFINEPPTAENISKIIFQELESKIEYPLSLCFVKVYETQDSWVTIKKE